MTPEEKQQLRHEKRRARLLKKRARLREELGRVEEQLMESPKDGLQKHTLNLHPGDYERLRELFPDLGAGYVIRKIVRNYIRQVEADRGEMPKLTINF